MAALTTTPTGEGAPPARPTIVYIVGIGHSGSTLLDLMLGSHTQAVSIGEICNLSAGDPLHANRLASPCTCGAPSKRDCPFWAEIGRRIEPAGLTLDALDMSARDAGDFERHNRAALEAVAATTGARFVIDSSKYLHRLEGLQAAGWDVRTIHLVRSPLGVVSSNVRRGRSWLWHAAEWSWWTTRIRAALAGRPHIVLRYEDLARRPRVTIARLMEWLGVALEERQLRWADHTHHTYAGNKLRFRRDRFIRLDTSWRERLHPVAKAGVPVIALPTLLPEGLLGAIDRVARGRPRGGRAAQYS